MSSTSAQELVGQRTDLAHWVIRVGGLVYVVGLVLLALGVYVDLPGFLGAYNDPEAWWPILVQLVAGGAAFIAWARLNRRNNRPVAVVLLGLGILTVLVLAIPSYWACPDQHLSQGWSVATRVVGLVTNNYVIDMFQAPTCQVDGVPLALQFARLAQLTVLLVAFASAVIALLRTQVDRVAVRLSPRVTLALGVDDESVGLLPRIARNIPGSTLVVHTRDPLAAWLGAARNAGWRVFVGADTAGLVRRMVTRRGDRHALRDLYVFTRPEFAATRQVTEILEALGPSTLHDPVRVLLRSENPWHAEHLRQQAVALGSSAVIDTISKYEVCAQDLLEDARKRGADLIIVTGRSELTVAILEAAAQELNERAFLRDETEFQWMVVGEHAESSLAEQHAIAAWHGRPQLSATVDPRSDLAEVASDASRDHVPAIILTNEPNAEDQRAAAVLATQIPECLIYVSYAGIAGLERQPMIGRTFAFGASLITDRSAVGRWERLARLVHSSYIAEYPEPADPARRPWDDLSPFYRESNIRQVTTLISSAVAVGRVWGASPKEATEPTTEQLDGMAGLEHTSWFNFLRANGWTWGPRRDRAGRRHPDLLPWKELSAESKEKTRRGVTEGLRLLATLGYHSTDGPDATWVRFRRLGEVTAARRHEPWTWTTSDGTVMHGAAGDWEVTDNDGVTRSITPSIFEKTHEPVAADRWRRTGEIRGRQARPGEIVHSLEGDQTARLGQWVLRGVEGEEWLVPAEHLETSYDRIGADPSEPAADHR